MAERLEFRRDIGLFMAVMIGIGAMMGPGIFALPGELAKLVGPLGILVYLVMGVLTIFTALNYSELGAAIPIAGGGYSFASRTLSKPVAFFTGWFFWIGNTLGCALYAIIFALTIRGYIWHDANLILIVLVTTAVFGYINFRGMSEALKVITVMNLIELAILIGVATLGISHFEPANLDPIAPMGWGGFVPGMALIYISYVGFELITVASEEIINPGKVIPRAIIITLAVGILIYVFVVGIMMGTVPYEQLGESEVPFIFMSEQLFGSWGLKAAVIATIMASLSAFSVTLGASARVLYALGRDGHFPKIISKLHLRYRTPHIALAICAVVVFLFSSSGIVKFAASMSDFGFLMGLGIVNFAVISLHQRMPNLRKPFRVALFPVVPILGVISCWAFVPALETRSFVLGGVLTVIGGAVYLIRPENRTQFQQLPAAMKRLRLLIEVIKRKRMRVLIISGGQQGRNIADRLLAKDEYRLMFRTAEHQVTFIEEDEKLCEELERRYNVPIYHGDGSKRELLEQVGIDNIDVAIAASDDDGQNVLVALQAKRVGVTRVISILQDPDYLSLLKENGIVAISSPWATAAMVEDHLDRPGVADLFEIGGGAAGLVSVVIPQDAEVHDKTISEIDIPRDVVAAAVIREDKYVIPRGDTQVHSGDTVVFVGPPEAIRAVQTVFTATG